MNYLCYKTNRLYLAFDVIQSDAPVHNSSAHWQCHLVITKSLALIITCLIGLISKSILYQY